MANGIERTVSCDEFLVFLCQSVAESISLQVFPGSSSSFQVVRACSRWLQFVPRFSMYSLMHVQFTSPIQGIVNNVLILPKHIFSKTCFGWIIFWCQISRKSLTQKSRKKSNKCFPLLKNVFNFILTLIMISFFWV